MMLLGCGAFAAAMITLGLYHYGPCATWIPPCLFHRLTGFSCPGCGMTRAFHAALHGRFVDAFQFNPLGVMMLVVLLVWVGLQIPAWLRDSPQPSHFKITPSALWWILGAVLAYGVLRNLPLWSFTLLAPP
jgi:hypothetical protein